VISGGVRLTNWTNTGGNLWKTALPASTQYFENLFYNGERRLRPRLGGYLGTYFRVADSVYLNSPAPPAAAPEANCSVYTSGTGWECFDRFLYNPADPVTNAWKNLAPPTGNACGQPAGNSALTGDIELVIFEKFYVGRQRISCVDTTEHIIYLTGPTVVNAGIADAVGFIPQHRYVIENIEDQLTQPGQWFLDRSTTPWTLTYLAGTGENPNNDSVIMPQLQQILVASNLQDVTFRGLTIEYGNFTVPAVGFDSDDSQSTAAVSFQNSQHITFDSGTVAHTSANGLEFFPVSILNPIRRASPAIRMRLPRTMLSRTAHSTTWAFRESVSEHRGSTETVTRTSRNSSPSRTTSWRVSGASFLPLKALSKATATTISIRTTMCTTDIMGPSPSAFARAFRDLRR